VRLERRIDVAAPASDLWAHVTDWQRQGEWVPMTRVEVVDGASGLGGQIRAWTGVGKVGFWDPMTITGWERLPDGGGRCEVLHLGQLVRGEGEFSVVSRGADASTFVWAEVLVLPLGPLGAAGWRLVRPAAERVIDRALRTLRDQVEKTRGA
jgi:hypothetical protein